MTYKDLCEDLSRRLAENGVEISPVEIWNMSPTGELWPIHDLEQRLDDLDALKARVLLPKEVR